MLPHWLDMVASYFSYYSKYPLIITSPRKISVAVAVPIGTWRSIIMYIKQYAILLNSTIVVPLIPEHVSTRVFFVVA